MEFINPKGLKIINKDDGNIKGRFVYGYTIKAIQNVMEEYRGKVSLIYLDPPFLTGKVFYYRQRIGDVGWTGDRAAIKNMACYPDKMTMDEYLVWMEQVLILCRDLLHDEGSIYFHVDYRLNAQMKILLDKIFGAVNFLNEIIWSYSSGGRAKKHYSRKHDNILFYSKTKHYYFDIESIGTPRGRQKRNHMKRQTDSDGRVYFTIKSAGKIYRYYEDSKIYPSDVWSDISHIQQKSPERTGYDTQKPEKLLERIIKASSKPGDIVADFFSGSGTTLYTAAKLGRNFLGCDKSLFSMAALNKRIININGSYEYAFEKPLHTGDYPIINYNLSEDYINIISYDHKGRDEDISTDNLDAVDCWGTGYMEDDVFIAENISERTHKTPYLDDILPKNDVVMIRDVWGGIFFFTI